MTANPLPEAAARSGPRRVALVLALLLAVGGVGLLLNDLSAAPPDLLRMKQVRSGMTEAEVRAVFGTRPETGRPWQLEHVAPAPAAGGTPRYWYCDAGIVEVFFGADGRATGLVRSFSYEFGGLSPFDRRVRDAKAAFGL